MHAFRTVVVAAILCRLPVAQTTWIVDANGTGQFTTIAAAFDTAAPGDVLRVLPGVYAGLHRNPGKGATILGAAPGVLVTSPVWIARVPAGQRLLLSGFTIDASNDPWVSPGVAISAGLWIVDCGNVVLTDMTVEGPDAVSAAGFSEGGLGVVIDQCHAILGSTTARGGAGRPGLSYGSRGGTGCRLVASHGALSGCTIRAGDNVAGGLGSYANHPSLHCAQSVAAIDACQLVGNLNDLSLTAQSSRVLLANHGGLLQTVSVSTPPSSIEYEGNVTVPAWTVSSAVPRAQPGLVGPPTVAIGSTLQWTLRGGPGNVFATAISVGTAPLDLPPLFATPTFTATHSTSVLWLAGAVTRIL